MTKAEVRDLLRSHLYATQKIKALEEEKHQLRLDAQGGAISFDGTGPSPVKDNTAEIRLMKLADKENAIDQEIQRLTAHKDKVRQFIADLHDDGLESVLIFRYILYCSEEQTAEKLHYAPRTIQEKIRRAVRKLCEKNA
ncbi:MAG: hypothetical protein IJ071_05115 [Ruminococcus sp.]|nr:hypothetical protein [Ruminococcus sp.]